MAISGVSNALVKRDAENKLGDESITGVALLAGNEVCMPSKLSHINC